MDRDYLVNRIRDAVCRTGAFADVAETITDVLISEGVDLRWEPTLEDVKHMLVEAYRTVDELRRVAC